MKVYVIQYLERYCDTPHWVNEKVVGNEDKAKLYCERMQKQWDEKYKYQEYIVEEQVTIYGKV